MMSPSNALVRRIARPIRSSAIMYFSSLHYLFPILILSSFSSRSHLNSINSSSFAIFEAMKLSLPSFYVLLSFSVLLYSYAAHGLPTISPRFGFSSSGSSSPWLGSSGFSSGGSISGGYGSGGFSSGSSSFSSFATGVGTGIALGSSGSSSYDCDDGPSEQQMKDTAREKGWWPTSNATHEVQDQGFSSKTFCDFTAPGLCRTTLIDPSNKDNMIMVWSQWCTRYVDDVKKKMEKGGFGQSITIPDDEFGHCDWYTLKKIDHKGGFAFRGRSGKNDTAEHLPSAEVINTVEHAMRSTVPGAEIALIVIFVGSIVLLVVGLSVWCCCYCCCKGMTEKRRARRLQRDQQRETQHLAQGLRPEHTEHVQGEGKFSDQTVWEIQTNELLLGHPKTTSRTDSLPAYSTVDNQFRTGV